MTKQTVQRMETARTPAIWDWFGSTWPTPLRMFEPQGVTRLEEFVQDGRYVLRTELPGIDPDRDVEITISEGVLNIHGERREEHRDRQRSEFVYGSFSRSVTLPKGADPDDTRATYRDGILEVSVKLGEQKPDTHKVQVEHRT